MRLTQKDLDRAFEQVGDLDVKSITYDLEDIKVVIHTDYNKEDIVIDINAKCEV